MVYARVSKTRDCNGLESSSLSPGTSNSQFSKSQAFLSEFLVGAGRYTTSTAGY